MGKFIEPLESRQLFSNVPAVAALAADVRVVLADLTALKNTGHSNFAAIEAELKTAGELKASGNALKALGTHATAAENVLPKNVTKTGPLIIADANKFVAAVNRFNKKPTSAPLLKARVATLAKLKKDSSARLTAITTSIANVASTDKTYADQLFALNSGDANLKATFATTGASSSAARATLGNAATKAFDTDAEEVITELLGA